MQKTEFKISGNNFGRPMFRVPVVITIVFFLSFLFTTQNCFAQSSSSSKESVQINTTYVVSTFSLPDGMWGYLIKANGINVFISHNRSTGEINAPDYTTEEEALIAGEIKVNELKKKTIQTNSSTNKHN